ncbi:MAG: hypothetical protein KF813_14515, partial [Trueperaceae bacterium]|nr:hypothetical protein [Trueperaceae bacterium]
MAAPTHAATSGAGKLLVRPTWTKGVLSWVTTVDHKRLGLLYIMSAFMFMAVASVEAFIMRLQLMRPEQQLVSPDT